MVAEPVSEIDESMIERLIRAFYADAKLDPLIGPVFDSKVHDWDAHLGQMFDFWSAIMLGSGRYRGRPMAKHLPLPIDAQHFDRWLTIFAATARKVCPPQAADRFIEQAGRIGAGLQAGMAQYQDSLSRVSLNVIE